MSSLSRMGTTVIETQGSAEGVVAGSVFGACPPQLQKKSIWANSSRIELECGTTPA